MGLYQILTAPGSFKFYAEKSFPNPNAVSSPTSFGQKSIGYGDTNQPYIKIPLPDSGVTYSQLNKLTSNPNPYDFSLIPGFEAISNIGGNIRYNPSSWGLDFLNRGNAFGLLRAGDDTLRLTKFFTDNRSSTGELFIVKQNLLSRVAVKTEAAYGAAYGLGVLNGGVYTPASTIGQAALSVIEGHLLKQGIDPTGIVEGLSIRTYQQAIFSNQFKDNTDQNNRLIKLSKLPYITAAEATVLNVGSTYKISQDSGHFMSYGGGPDALLGIGNTQIKYATDKTGKVPSLTVAQFPKTDNLLYLTWNRKQLSEAPNNNSFDTPTIGEDFRKPLLDDSTLAQQIFLSASPSYKPNESNTGNIEKRINFRGAGARGNRKNYQEGKKDVTAGKVLGPTDLINAFPIYQGATATDNELVKDLVDFRIGIYDNNTIGLGRIIQLNWLHFRILLDDFSDSYGADWKAINYMGRAESFYKYESFKRDISIGFTVAAQSKQELLPIYKKLNYLASSMAPSYSTNGFIRGNLCRITLGNWLWEQPGFISSVDLSIPEESPWEINLPLDGSNPDKEVRQVPHMVQVKIKFTPIHTFRPEINKFDSSQSIPVFKTEDLNATTADSLIYKDPAFGPQKYISLYDSTNGSGYQRNYTSEELGTFRSIEQNDELAFSATDLNQEIDDSAWGSPLSSQ